MPRAVEEWIGATADTPIPKRVKLRVLVRDGGRCHRTGHKFRPGDVIEFDHIVALCNGGENRETNIAPILGGKIHQAKTAADVAERAKTDRLRAKNLGLWPKSKTPLRSRGFQKTRTPHV
jgi:5-methylcytosine-specific restriction protein A